MRGGSLFGLAGCKVLCGCFSAKSAMGAVSAVATLEGVDERVEFVEACGQAVGHRMAFGARSRAPLPSNLTRPLLYLSSRSCGHTLSPRGDLNRLALHCSPQCHVRNAKASCDCRP